MPQQSGEAKRNESSQEQTLTDEQIAEAKQLGQKAVEGEAEDNNLDDLLTEIDNVLETNAVDFVKNYIQKGGQ